MTGVIMLVVVMIMIMVVMIFMLRVISALTAFAFLGTL